jgi:hypothetical protein
MLSRANISGRGGGVRAFNKLVGLGQERPDIVAMYYYFDYFVLAGLMVSAYRYFVLFLGYDIHSLRPLL